MFDTRNQHSNHSYQIPERFTSRCITSLCANTNDNLFIAATNSLKAPKNELHLMQFLEDQSKLVNRGIYTVSGLINKVSTHPTDETLVMLSMTHMGIQKGLLGKIPSVSNQGIIPGIPQEKKPLELLLEFTNDREIHSLISLPREKSILLCDAKKIISYSIEKQAPISSISILEPSEATKTELDPHHKNLVATIQNKNILIHDLRENKTKFEISDAHRLNVLDLDFNPNKQYCLMTCGEDCLIKFWDVRKPSLALKTIDDIANSVECVKYNKFHDLLVISSSNDGSVNLHKVTSVSSAPVLSSNYIDKPGIQLSKEEDSLIKCYDEHEDSVYSVAWSPASAWVFASVSYRGNIMINIVPNEEKYKILLQK